MGISAIYAAMSIAGVPSKGRGMNIKTLALDAKMKRMEKSGDFERLKRVHAEAAGFLVRGTMAVRQGVELPGRFADLERIAVLVKDATKIVSKYTPCADGCSACCHQAVTITEPEAVRIGKAAGRTPAMVPAITREEAMRGKVEELRSGDVGKYTGQPCPFLVDDRCSVYAARPVICRLHHSMHSDNSLCQHDEIRDVPAMDFSALEGAFVITQQSYTLADIRDFFPSTGQREGEIADE